MGAREAILTPANPIRMHNVNPIVCRKVDVVVPAILTEIGSPDSAVIPQQSRCYGPPVDQVLECQMSRPGASSKLEWVG